MQISRVDDMAANNNRRILILRHADTIQTTFGQNWLSYYDQMNNGLKVVANTPYNYDFTPVPDVNLPVSIQNIIYTFLIKKFRVKRENHNFFLLFFFLTH